MVRASSSKDDPRRLRVPAAARRARVILVDDDAPVRTALGRLLRGAGLNVTLFEHPSDVLSALLPKKDVCLVLDIYMPEMGGVQLWQALRARGIEIPTILITGQRNTQAEHCAKQVSAIAVLYKPVEEEQLFDAIERALATAG